MESERKIAWARYIEIMYQKYHQQKKEEEDQFFSDDLYWTDGYGN